MEIVVLRRRCELLNRTKRGCLSSSGVHTVLEPASRRVGDPGTAMLVTVLPNPARPRELTRVELFPA